jgi:hypothetical protein
VDTAEEVRRVLEEAGQNRYVVLSGKMKAEKLEGDRRKKRGRGKSLSAGRQYLP